jgi:hypothetical protein
MVPDEVLHGLAQQGGSMGGASVGKSKLDQEETVPVVRAEGMIFPILVHELVKGLTELVSHGGLPKVGAMKKAVLKGDTLDAETWDLLLGPEIWKNLADAIGPQDRKLLMNVYDVLVQLPPDKFHEVTRGLTAGGDAAKAQAQRLLAAVKNRRKFESMKTTKTTDLTLEDLPTPYAGPRTADPEVDPDVAPGIDDPALDPDEDEDEEDLPGQDPWRRHITPGEEPDPKARFNRR